jgi:hypothetical protein
LEAAALREEFRFVFENRLLRRIFETKSGEMAGGWRKLHNDELYNLYSSPNSFRMIKPRRIKWARHVARTRKMGNTYKTLVWKHEGQRQLGRPCLRLEVKVNFATS